MPDLGEAVGPGPRGVLLAGGRRVAVVHVNGRIHAAGQVGNPHPGPQRTARAVEILDLVVQLGGAVRGGKDDIVAVVLGVGPQVAVGVHADQHREVGEIGYYLGGVDGDRLAIQPVAGGEDFGRTG